MRESTTYQSILAEGEAKGEIVGRVREAKALLLRAGTRRFGLPSTPVALEIESVADLSQLEALHEQLIDAPSWEQLLATRS